MPPPSLRWPNLLRNGLFLSAILMQAYSCCHAGSFWLDEADSVSVARMPLAPMWHSMAFDTFPLAHVLIFKIWLKVFGFLAPETALRGLGFGVGAGIAAVFLSFSNRFARGGIPLFFGLFLLDPPVVRYLGGARPYGLATLFFALLLFQALAALQTGRRGNVWLAILAGLGALHCHYLSALGVGAILIALWIAMPRASHSAAARQMALGLALSMATMLVYLPLLRASSDWMPVTRQPTRDLGAAFFSLNWLLNGMSASPAVFWILAGIATLVLGFRPRRRLAAGERNLAAFALLGAGGAAGLLLSAMWALRIHFSPWYFLPTLALLCLSLDLVWAQSSLPRLSQIGLQIALGLVALYQIGDGLSSLRQPMATIDRLAALVDEEAKASDLVLVAPWSGAVTWAFYARGPAPFTTLPPLADYSVVRFDLAEKGMQAPQNGVIPRLENTLRRGDRVFVVGQLEQGAASLSSAEILRAAPRNNQIMGRARRALESQAALFLRAHARSRRVFSPQTECFSGECPLVEVYSGWSAGLS